MVGACWFGIVVVVRMKDDIRYGCLELNVLGFFYICCSLVVFVLFMKFLLNFSGVFK